MPSDVTIQSTALPAVQWNGNIQDLLTLFAAHLEGTFVGDVLTGQVDGTAPTSDIGLWINGNVIYAWDDDEAKYLPIPLVIGRVWNGSLNLTNILSTATANRTLYAPDKDGTIATTKDVYGGRDIQTLGGTTASVDWSKNANNWIIALSGNTTITHDNLPSNQSQEQYVWVDNNETAYTVTFSDVIWLTTAVAATATSGNRARTLYKFYKPDQYVIGEKIGSTTISTSGGSGGDVTAPAKIAQYRYATGYVYLEYNELLQGGSLSTSDFAVTKSGSPVSLTSVTASGAKIIIRTATNFSTSQSVTVAYSGTSIKDLAGNAAATFGAVSAPNVTPDGDGGGYGGGGLLP